MPHSTACHPFFVLGGLLRGDQHLTPYGHAGRVVWARATVEFTLASDMSTCSRSAASVIIPSINCSKTPGNRW
ncbi:hypothetical protein [Streptomyces sp. WAC00263]|uniref:hypothetical protein n=1 Tax=Streptomyces sp. WAC00263 TaxID=1917422 RepID=UPI001F511B50|nr:hypothetical protein [Streptomyces sp. WAC00263]